MSDYSRVVRIIIDGDEAVNGAEKIRSKIAALETEIAKLERNLSSCSVGMEGLDKTSADYGRRLREMQARAKGYGENIGILQRQHLAQTNALRKYNEKVEITRRTLDNLSGATLNELQAVRRLTSQMLSQAVPGTEKYNLVLKQHREVCRQINVVRAEMSEGVKKERALIGRITEGFNQYAGVVASAIAAVTGLTMTVRKAVQSYGEMDEEMNNVRKYTGQTKEEVLEMNEAFKKMNTRTSRIELNQLAEDAGRLGITAKRDILDFVDAADKINVALGDDLGENAVKDIGKLAQLFGEDKKKGLRGAMLATGSAINELAQNSSAAGDYLVDFTARVAGVGKQAGMSQANIMAYASVLDQNMQQAETSSTAFSQLITKMFQNPEKFARLAGRSVSEFTHTLRTDANAALLQFFQAMKSKGGFEGMARMFDQMGMDGTRCIAVFSTMADKLEDIQAAQKLANRAYDEGQSVIDEFNVQNSSFNAEMDKARKRFNDMAVDLGEKLVPVIPYLTSSMSMMVKTLAAVVGFVSEHTRAVATAAIAVAAYTLALKAQVGWQLLSNKAFKESVIYIKLHQVWTKASGVALLAWNVVAGLCAGNMVRMTLAMKLLRMELMKNPFTLVATAVAALVAGIYLLVTRTEQADEKTKALNKSQKDMQEVMKAANDSIKQELAHINLLTSVIHDNKRSIDERREAINKLKQIIPGYNAEMTNEGKIIRENTKAVKDYVTELKKQAIAKALLSKTEDLAGVLLEQEESKGRRQNAVSIRRKRLEDYEKSEEYQTALKHQEEADAHRVEGYNTGPSVLVTAADRAVFERHNNLTRELNEANGWVKDINESISETNGQINSFNNTARRLGIKLDQLIPTDNPATGNGGGDGGDSSGGKGKDKEAGAGGKNSKKDFPQLDELKKRHELEIAEIKLNGMKRKETEEQVNNAVWTSDEKYYNDRLALIKKYQAKTKDREKGEQLKKDAVDTETALLETRKKADGQRLEALKETRDKELKIIEDSAESQRLILERLYNEGEISRQEYEERSNKIALDAARSKLETQREFSLGLSALNIEEKNLESQLLAESGRGQLQAAVEFAKTEFTMKAALMGRRLDLIQAECDATIEKYQGMYGMGLISEEKFNKEKLNARRSALRKELALVGVTEEEMVALAKKGGSGQVKEMQDSAKKKMRVHGLSEEQVADKTKQTQDIQKESEKQWVEDWLASSQQKQQSYMQVMQQISGGMGNIIDQFATNQEMKLGDVGYQMLLLGLDQLAQIVQMELVAILAKSLSSLGPIAGPIAFVGLQAAVKMAFALVKRMIHRPSSSGGSSADAGGSSSPATATRSVTKQHAAGKYDVIGEQDGKRYNGVPYVGTPVSGIVSSPALIAERGDELVINHEDLGRLRRTMAYPLIVQSIQQVRRPVRQYADGSYSAMGNVTPLPDYGDLRKTVKDLSRAVAALADSTGKDRPLKAYVVYQDLERRKDAIDRMRNRFTRNSK